MPSEEAHHRFAEATRTHLLAPLPGGVEIASCSAGEWKRLSAALWSDSSRPMLEVDPALEHATRGRAEDLDALLAPPLAHHLVLYAAGEPVAAYHGRQEGGARYHMVNTIFHPAWRGRGLYSALLARIESAAHDSGFLEMSSRHRADNNAILVPKLRAGWVIAAFEVAIKQGLLVHLRRYLHAGLADAHGYRIDGSRADALREAGVQLP